MKVTQQQVMDAVKKSTYTILPDGRTTVCQLTLTNGYTVIGTSSCVDPAEFNKAEGEKWAWNDALEEVWPVLGYDLMSARNKQEIIARVCHEVNRAYCQALGDMSQPTWEEAPDWQRVSARGGVAFHTSGDHGPAASHVSWMAQKEAEGWKYGPVKDAEKKEHPCYLPYEELPAEQRAKDYIFRAIVHAMR